MKMRDPAVQQLDRVYGDHTEQPRTHACSSGCNLGAHPPNNPREHVRLMTPPLRCSYCGATDDVAPAINGLPTGSNATG